MRKIVEISTIKYLLLEKILFQKEEDYYTALELITKHSIKCFVNCPRRIFPFYQLLKKKLRSAEYVDFIYTGGDWGMACNAVHMLDLYSFLTNDIIEKINVDLLNRVKESKRRGFTEILGIISGDINKESRFVLKSSENNVPSVLTINSDVLSIIIYESLGKSYFGQKIDNWEFKELDFNVLYQSNMTNIVLDDLLENGTCELTSYEESMKIHLPLISSLTSYFTKNKIDGCPIT